ncbi:MAG: sugar ABC transporter permease [Armatimonadota bacterium]|nr:sugar ABC transporter permease [Armatimonadota bacterium]MDR7535936.1 sugar ABC transporter permease [Armatimonadota bacterium]
MPARSGAGAAERGARLPRRWRRAVVAYLFLTPALVLLALFTFYPVAVGTLLALFDYDVISPPRFVGLAHFRALAGDRFFWIALGNSLKYLLVVPVLQILSIGLAVAVNVPLRGITWFRAAYYLPVVTSMVVAGLMWRWLYEQDGLVNFVLTRLGLLARPVAWLGHPDLALFAVMVVTLWKGLGYYMVIYLAGLQGIPPEYEEAAAADGATRWQVFRWVTLPLLRPSILLASTISAIAALKVFEEIYVMTGGGPMFRTYTMFYYMFDRGFQQLDLGYAAALGVVLAAAVLVLSAVTFRLFRHGGWRYY